MTMTRFVLLTTLVLIAIAGVPAATAAADEPMTPDGVVSDGQGQPGEAPESVFDCTPASAATFNQRVHLRCTNGVSVPPYTIYYWAVSTANESEAARAMSVFLTAVVTAKPVRIYYTGSDTSGTTIGCVISDCRLAWGIEQLQ